MVRLISEMLYWNILFSHSSDEEMDEANPIEANDSDYDPTKETKREVLGFCMCNKTRLIPMHCCRIPLIDIDTVILQVKTCPFLWSLLSIPSFSIATLRPRWWALKSGWAGGTTWPWCTGTTPSAPSAAPPKACTWHRTTWWPCPAVPAQLTPSSAT